MSKGRFLDDVEAQSRVLDDLATYYGRAWRPTLEQASDFLRKAHLVLLTGMGSSLYAGGLASLVLAQAGVTAVAVDASELLHYGMSMVSSEMCVVAISQSGASVETRRVVEERPHGVPVIAICNDLESPLARAADVTLPLFAGEEAATSSKTYVASLAVSLLMAWITRDRDREFTSRLKQLARQLKEATSISRSEAGSVLTWFEEGGSWDSIFYIGRGPQAATAMQASLITKELASVHAEGMTAGAFRHGPLELAGGGFRGVLFAPSGNTQSLMVKLALDLAAYGSKVWLVTDEAGARQVSLPDTHLRVTVLPHVEREEMAPILSIVPVEFFGAALAQARGRVPGEMRRASKVTKEE